MSEPEPGVGRRCEICQALVPANPADESLGPIQSDPCSLIEHRWSVHGIAGVTRCPHCAIAMGTGDLASHISDQHDPYRPIRNEFEGLDDPGDKIVDELGERITEARESVEKLLQELRPLSFWTIVAAIIVALLLYPLVKALIGVVVEAVETLVKVLIGWVPGSIGTR